MSALLFFQGQTSTYWQDHFLKKDFIYLFLDRGEGREKEERNNSVCLPLVCPLLGTWPATQACALTGNRTGDSLVHSLHSIH